MAKEGIYAAFGIMARGGNMAYQGRSRAVRRTLTLRSATLAWLCWALATACAGAGGAKTGDRVRDAPAAYALPQPDPALKLTVQERLVTYGLEKVVVKVAVSRTGTPTLIEFLTPDLTPAAVRELRQAFSGCIWKPGLGPDGEPVEGEITLLFQAKK